MLLIRRLGVIGYSDLDDLVEKLTKGADDARNTDQPHCRRGAVEMGAATG